MLQQHLQTPSGTYGGSVHRLLGALGTYGDSTHRVLGALGPYGDSNHQLLGAAGMHGGHSRALIEHLLAQHHVLGTYPGEDRRALMDKLLAAPAYGSPHSPSEILSPALKMEPPGVPASDPPAPPPPPPPSPMPSPPTPPPPSPTLLSPTPPPSPPPHALPVGQCYCRYDLDWEQWSLNEPACK